MQSRVLKLLSAGVGQWVYVFVNGMIRCDGQVFKHWMYSISCDLVLNSRGIVSD